MKNLFHHHHQIFYEHAGTHQWAPFQVAGLPHAWQISHQIFRCLFVTIKSDMAYNCCVSRIMIGSNKHYHILCCCFLRFCLETWVRKGWEVMTVCFLLRTCCVLSQEPPNEVALVSGSSLC